MVTGGGWDYKTEEVIDRWLAETRVTNPKTGGEKGSKPAQLGAVDPASLLELASVAGMGSDKYARYNFARGVDWSLFFDAMMRHSLAFWGGEDMDPESGLPHMAHAAWHACALLTMMRRHRDLDDRFPRERTAEFDGIAERLAAQKADGTARRLDP